MARLRARPLPFERDSVSVQFTEVTGMSEKRTLILNSLLTLILVAAIYQFIKSELLTSDVKTIDRNVQSAQRQIGELKEAASATFEQTMRRFDEFGRQLSALAPKSKSATAPKVANAQPNANAAKETPVPTSRPIQRNPAKRNAAQLVDDERRDQEAKLNRDRLQFLSLESRVCDIRATGALADVRMKRCKDEMNRLAKQGNSAAQKWLGSEASDEQHDLQTAIGWFEQAAKQGDTEAMDRLGSIYADDARPVADPMKALYWYGKAATLGDVNAMGAIGGIYEEGRLTGQSESEAIVWYELAVKAVPSFNRNRPASLNFASILGDIYYNGTGVEQDKMQAYQWYAIACADAARLNIPGESGCMARNKVASELSPIDVAKAQAQATEWENMHRYAVAGWQNRSKRFAATY